MKTKAFTYTRKSQDRDDRQVLSIEGQQKALSSLIRQKNIAPVYLAPEERTAAKPGRPVFNEMMERIEAGEARHVVTWMANRLSRNYIDGGRIMQALHTGKLLSIITPERIYHSTPTDMFTLHIELGMAKMYSDEISQNVKRGYAAKYERGEYPTHAPVGYLNATLNGYKNIVPDPDRAPRVIRVFQEASTGKYTLDELFKYSIDVEGLTSKKGNTLPKQTLYDLLRNPIYYGVYQHGGDWHIGKYEALITKDLFDKVQYSMGWTRKRQRNSTSGASYPFKGVVTCANCSYNITAYAKRKKLASGHYVTYHYYSCTRKSKKISCKEPQASAVEIETEVSSQLDKIVIRPEEAEVCLKLLRHYHQETVENQSHRLSEWRRDQARTEKRLVKLLEMRVDGELDHDEFMNEKKRLNDSLVRTKEQIEKVHTNADEWLELAESFFSSTVTLAETFKIANHDEKRKLLTEIGSNWELGNKKVLFTPRKPYDLLINRTDSSNWRTRPDSNRRSPP